MIIHSNDETFQAERFTTAKHAFYLWNKAKTIGRIYIRADCINLDLDCSGNYTENDFLQIHSIIKKIANDPDSKKVQAELTGQ